MEMKSQMVKSLKRPMWARDTFLLLIFYVTSEQDQNIYFH